VWTAAEDGRTEGRAATNTTPGARREATRQDDAEQRSSRVVALTTPRHDQPTPHYTTTNNTHAWEPCLALHRITMHSTAQNNTSKSSQPASKPASQPVSPLERSQAMYAQLCSGGEGHFVGGGGGRSSRTRARILSLEVVVHLSVQRRLCGVRTLARLEPVLIHFLV